MAESNVSSSQVRADAARAVRQVMVGNRTIDWVSENHPTWMAESFAKELVFGTVRYIYLLQALIDRRLKKPLREKDQDLYALMLVGAYQLVASNKPSHVVVNETVAACHGLRKPWARGLLNGVLRGMHRDVLASQSTPEEGGNYPTMRG